MLDEEVQPSFFHRRTVRSCPRLKHDRSNCAHVFCDAVKEQWEVGFAQPPKEQGSREHNVPKLHEREGHHVSPVNNVIYNYSNEVSYL